MVVQKRRRNYHPEIYTGPCVEREWKAPERTAAEAKARRAQEARRAEKRVTLCAVAFAGALWLAVFAYLNCWF